MLLLILSYFLACKLRRQATLKTSSTSQPSSSPQRPSRSQSLVSFFSFFSMSGPFALIEDEKTSHSHHLSTSPLISRPKPKTSSSRSILRRSSKAAKPVLVIHGGAGTLDRAKVSLRLLSHLIKRFRRLRFTTFSLETVHRSSDQGLPRGPSRSSPGRPPSSRERWRGSRRCCGCRRVHGELVSSRHVFVGGGQRRSKFNAADRLMFLFLQDCPLFNSGHGAVFNTEGKNELEALVHSSLVYSSKLT